MKKRMMIVGVLVVLGACGREDAREGVVDPVPAESGTIHNAILEEFNRHVDLTSDVRLDWNTWSDILVECSQKVCAEQDLAYTADEIEKLIVSVSVVLEALEQETGVDVCNQRDSPDPLLAFDRVMRALAARDWITPESARAVTSAVQSDGLSDGVVDADALDEAGRDALTIGFASYAFWNQMAASASEGPVVPSLDDEEPPCKKCGNYGTALADMIGSIVARMLCRGIGPCKDIGSAAASIAFIQAEGYCETHDCDWELPPPVCRPCW